MVNEIRWWKTEKEENFFLSQLQKECMHFWLNLERQDENNVKLNTNCLKHKKKEVSNVLRVGKRLGFNLKYKIKLYLGVPLAGYMLMISETI